MEENIMSMSHHLSNTTEFIFDSLEDLVPKDHLVRKLEASIDWGFIYGLVKHLYSPGGRPGIDPVILFKMLCINIVFGYNSMRRTCKEIEMNIAYRWFLGISFRERVPNYSTWSQNYIRRYNDSDVFDQIFQYVLCEISKNGMLDLNTVFGDSTHQKASANKNKYEDVEIEVVQKTYENELKEEINKDRIENGKKPLKEVHDIELQFDEKTGEEIEVKVKKTKHIKQSKTDPESGLFNKGEKEKCYAYSHQTLCERHGFVVAVKTVPGNIHDSVSFFDVWSVLSDDIKKYINNVCLDSGYNTPAVCRYVTLEGKQIVLPYKRPMTKKGFFKKYEYTYIKEFNLYICPNGQKLEYSTTDRTGYKQYKSDPDKCKECPFLSKCTNSRNHQKVLTRHVWAEYKEDANEFRHTDKWKQIYPKRKETIERVFADNKEKHNLRFTRLRGLKKNQEQASLIFAFHNLERYAKWTQ